MSHLQQPLYLPFFVLLTLLIPFFLWGFLPHHDSPEKHKQQATEPPSFSPKQPEDSQIRRVFQDPEDHHFQTSCQRQEMAVSVYHHWAGWSYVQTRNSGCESWCRLVDSPREADLVVFHTPSTTRPGPEFPGQQVAGWSMEPRLGIGFYAWEMGWVANVALTYNIDSNLPVLYMAPDFWQKTVSLKLPTKEEFDQRKGIVWVSSNCAKKRDSVMRELMTHIPIDSRGACLKNSPSLPPGHENLEPYYNEYKLVIGFEKVVDQDYVTEKFYYPFEANTVLVYFGPRSAHFYAPGNNSFVFARDFPTLEDLAEELRALTSDYDRWISYFDWKRDPVKPPGFGRLEAKSALHESILCRMCNCACNSTCSKESRGGGGIASLVPSLQDSPIAASRDFPGLQEEEGEEEELGDQQANDQNT